VLKDPDSPLNRYWDEEHDRYVLRCLLEAVALEFEPATLRAFQLVALDGVPGAQAADELGISLTAVYIARSRVQRRLRSLAEGLLDDLSWIDDRLPRCQQILEYESRSRGGVRLDRRRPQSP
jgi:DNA-directed RNA polymerase specialized sigma24 family protein